MLMMRMRQRLVLTIVITNSLFGTTAKMEQIGLRDSQIVVSPFNLQLIYLTYTQSMVNLITNTLLKMTKLKWSIGIWNSQPSTLQIANTESMFTLIIHMDMQDSNPILVRVFSQSHHVQSNGMLMSSCSKRAQNIQLMGRDLI